MADRKRASRNTRRQATRVAVIAFVAADCAGIAYVQHRMARQAESVEELAYAQPLVTPAAGSPALAFIPAAPALAVNEPHAAAAVVRAAPVAKAPPATLATVAPAATPRVVTTRTAPVGAPAPAAAPVLALGTAAVDRASAHPLRAPRIAPLAGLGAPHLAVTAPAVHPSHSPRHVASTPPGFAPAAEDSAFASAFTLDGEAPDVEQRFGQGGDGSGTGTLADLVTPREEPAPIFDRAGIAPVAGQAAAVDAPAPAAAAEMPALAPVAEAVPAPAG